MTRHVTIDWKYCSYCGVQLSERRRRPFTNPRGNIFSLAPALPTKEHIYPKSKGGWLTIPVCMPCNIFRGDKPLLRFLLSVWLRDRKRWAARTGTVRPLSPKALYALQERGKPK